MSKLRRYPCPFCSLKLRASVLFMHVKAEHKFRRNFLACTFCRRAYIPPTWDRVNDITTDGIGYMADKHIRTCKAYAAACLTGVMPDA